MIGRLRAHHDGHQGTETIDAQWEILQALRITKPARILSMESRTRGLWVPHELSTGLTNPCQEWVRAALYDYQVSNTAWFDRLFWQH